MDEVALLADAYIEARKSPDPSTQNGAILLNVHGEEMNRAHNTFPEGIEARPERLASPLKYTYVEHAERNVIYTAALTERPFYMVCPWASCADCARAIIQAGVKVLIRHKQAMDRPSDTWGETIRVADGMLREGGVLVKTLDVNISDELGVDLSVRYAGNLWKP